MSHAATRTSDIDPLPGKGFKVCCDGERLIRSLKGDPVGTGLARRNGITFPNAVRPILDGHVVAEASSADCCPKHLVANLEPAGIIRADAHDLAAEIKPQHIRRG